MMVLLPEADLQKWTRTIIKYMAITPISAIVTPMWLVWSGSNSNLILLTEGMMRTWAKKASTATKSEFF